MQGAFYKWPTFGSATAYSLVVMAIAAAIIILVITYFHRKRLRAESAWLALGHYAHKQGLKRDQLKILGVFFQELTATEKNEISFNHNLFANKLYSFLRNHPMVNAHDRVEIFDKLLPDAAAKIDVRSPDDLKQGELCSLDIGRRTYLGRVAKIKTPQILVSVNTGFSAADIQHQPCNIYVYRNNLGGFLLYCRVLKVSPEAIIVEYEEKIEFKGEQHLMTLMNLPVILKPWPPPEIDISPPQAEPGKTPATSAKPEFYQCETDRISDRAILLRFMSAYNGVQVMRQELWEAELDLPDGYQFKCRGRLIQSMTTPGFYILKFTDADEAARSRLFHFISQNSPSREMIS